MTWKEFKEAVEKQGVLDTDELSFIDWEPASQPLVAKYKHSNEVSILCDFSVEIEDV